LQRSIEMPVGGTALTNIVRPDDVRRQNQFGILMALRRGGPLSRTDLSAITGLSASTVTVITNSLLERGALVAEAIGDFTAGGRRGRPQIKLAACPSFATVATIFLGLDTIEVTLADYAGTPIATHTKLRPTHALGAEELCEAVAAALRHLLAAQPSGRPQLARIAIGAEGIVDADGQTLVSSPVTRAGSIPLGRVLSDEFATTVEMVNESNMIAEALRWKAPDRYGSDFATVLLSVGVGMGLYLNGKLFSGVRSSAVEFGHTIYIPDGAQCRCGRRGCIEAYAGLQSIWRAASGADVARAPDANLPEDALEQLASRARAANGPERQAFLEAGRAIGTGLSNLFTMFDPIPLVFTGPGVSALDLMMDSIDKALSETSFGLPVAVSVIDSYLDYRGLIREGALMRALVYLDQTMPGQGDARDPAISIS
jgi:predicted NBD/HSP70 family sugar kinase